MTALDIRIRPVEPQDFRQITDLYYHTLAGDFVDSCGRPALQSYLKELHDSPQGSVWCAVTEKGRVIGFTAGVVDRERFNRRWFLGNLAWLAPLMAVKFLSSSDFRGSITARLRSGLKRPANRVQADKRTEISKLDLGQAMSLWLAVDKDFRGGGNKDVASQLITSLERDLKGKGVTRVYGFTARTNLASRFVYMKNGWRVMPMDDKRSLLLKDL